MAGQERGRLGELRALGVGADAAVDHRPRGLTRTAQLDQLQRRVGGPQCGEQLVRVTLVGLHAGPGGVRLNPLSERIPERQIVGSRGRAGCPVGGGKSRRAPGHRRCGDDGGHSDGCSDATHHFLQIWKR